MAKHMHYNPQYQAAIQIYDTFEQAQDADKFAEQNAASVGVDLNVATTNKWIILRESEDTLLNTKYVGDDNATLENILSTMKNEQRIGEDMLKKRVATKKAENSANFSDIDSSVKNVLAPTSGPNTNR